jgi:hypothetical protein
MTGLGQIRSSGDVGSMSALLESGHGWTSTHVRAGLLEAFWFNRKEAFDQKGASADNLILPTNANQGDRGKTVAQSRGPRLLPCQRCPVVPLSRCTVGPLDRCVRWTVYVVRADELGWLLMRAL